MMAKLSSLTKQNLLLGDLEVARGFFERGRGLLGRAGLREDQALWIHRCNSIHTFFMKFSIDCVFIDRDLKVAAIYEDVAPWRVVWPVWGASSVIEMAAGSARRLRIQVGEELHVGAESP